MRQKKTPESGWANELEYSAYLSKADKKQFEFKAQEAVMAKARELLQALEDQLAALEARKERGGKEIETRITDCANFITSLRHSIAEVHADHISSVETQENLINAYFATKKYLEGYTSTSIQ